MSDRQANSHACPGCGHKIPVAEGAFVDHFVSRDGTRWMSDDTQPHISSRLCPGGNRPVRQSSLSDHATQHDDVAQHDGMPGETYPMPEQQLPACPDCGCDDGHRMQCPRLPMQQLSKPTHCPHGTYLRDDVCMSCPPGADREAQRLHALKQEAFVPSDIGPHLRAHNAEMENAQMTEWVSRWQPLVAAAKAFVEWDEASDPHQIEYGKLYAALEEAVANAK